MKLISKAIIKVTQSVKTLEKNATVGFGRNSYDGTKMFDVMIAFNQIMSDNGLSILTTDVQDDVRVERWEENGRTRQSIFCSVKVRYLLLHTSGESIELMSYGHGVDSQDKASGKALTYALKNCPINTFLTPVGKVDDTDAEHSDNIPVPQKSKAKKLPALPTAKYSDVAKFIQNGIGRDGVIIAESDRWTTIKTKYSISANAKKVIDGLVENVPA